MPHPIDIIKGFASLTEADEQRLRRLMVERKFRAHETISGVRALSTLAFYIKRGSARCYYIRKGKEYTVNFFFDDQFMAIPRHIVDTEETFTIEFLEPTTVITIYPIQLRDEIISKNIPVDQSDSMLFINTAIIQYVKSLEEHLRAILNYSAIERYNWAIRRFPRLLETATITQLASYLGLTKETLYRIRSGKY